MKYIFVSLSFFFSVAANAQVGIGTPTPNTSAQLELQSTTKGFLAPRMTHQEAIDIVSPATGLLIYQTDGVAGFYYYDGTAWKSGLGICESAVTNYLAKYTGPNSTCNSIIFDDGTNVGISNALPVQKLDVNGNVQFSGALMPNATAGTSGQVLTSAGAGTSPTWTSPTSLLFNNTFVAYSTASINTTTSWQNIPGMTITLTVPTGKTAKILLHAEVGVITNCATNSGISGTDIAIYRNAALLPNGGMKRAYLGDALIDLDENNTWGNTSMEVIETLGAGTYVYDLRCWQQLTGSCNASVAAGAGDPRQGMISALVILQ